jgi:hypothetical protein
MIPLKTLFRKALRTSGWVKMLSKEGDEKIWFDRMMHPNFGDKSQGSVQLSIELLPLTVSSQYRAGNGRDEPNQHPFLPKPDDRLQFVRILNTVIFKNVIGYFTAMEIHRRYTWRKYVQKDLSAHIPSLSWSWIIFLCANFIFSTYC